jgi:hypothetical protein
MSPKTAVGDAQTQRIFTLKNFLIKTEFNTELNTTKTLTVMKKENRIFHPLSQCFLDFLSRRMLYESNVKIWRENLVEAWRKSFCIDFFMLNSWQHREAVWVFWGQRFLVLPIPMGSQAGYFYFEWNWNSSQKKLFLNCFAWKVEPVNKKKWYFWLVPM